MRIKAHKIRASLGDEKGKPGNLLPARQYLRSRKVYQRKIAALTAIERELFTKAHISEFRYRERDNKGRYLASEYGDVSDQFG